MLSNALTKRFVLGAFLALMATSAPALEVTLDEVTSEGTAGGERALRIDGRAKFQFDPDTSTLTSTGTWTAEYMAGPSRLTRFSHKVEDMTVSPDRFSMKSYECVEGTFATILVASNCGNYRFGQNALDDGGMADDEVVGSPKSLASFTVTSLTWDGESLLLILSSDNAGEQIFPESSLKLKFSAVKPRPTSPQPPVR